MACFGIPFMVINLDDPRTVSKQDLLFVATQVARAVGLNIIHFSKQPETERGVVCPIVGE
ncbi:hypothetical protein D3C84_542430 [compost metagenome]